MKISLKLKNKLEDLYQLFLKEPKILRMKDIPMHRGSNCYIHSFKVAKLAIKRALRHKKGNLEVILIASVFHDYYLYDWRKDRGLLKHHGKRHPYIASKNAKEDFDIPEEARKVIESHMWPINISEFPKTKEARIVSLADKTICLREVMCTSSYKKKREEKYLLDIAKLFDK